MRLVKAARLESDQVSTDVRIPESVLLHNSKATIGKADERWSVQTQELATPP